MSLYYISNRYFLLFSFAILCSSTLAQSYSIKGKVVDARRNQPIEFATIMVTNSETDQPITGITTDLEGNFIVKVEQPNVVLEISFIGYVNQKIESIEFKDKVANLEIIQLEENAEVLEEVVVRAEKSSTEFKLDRRVFNVGKDLSSTGASALEVLNNVPSVNVNIEGEISLRGSNGVQILINGKPSVLAEQQGNALGTITADMIESIEVITNPSAKYDAEGTSGIINIIIKKEERRGLNGSVSLNTGIPHNHSFGLSLNRRTEKFNLFSQIGMGYRELPNDSENINENLVSGKTIFSDGTDYRNETFYNFILGTDYYINPTNVLTLSGNFAYEIEDQPSRYNFSVDDGSGVITDRWFRTETTEATNPKWQYELQYKSDFKDHKDHFLLFSAIGNFFGKDQSSEFTEEAIFGNPDLTDQLTRTNFQEAKYTFGLDYTKPFAEKWTIETGAQYVLQDVSNDFAVSNSINGEFIEDPNLTNIFEYTQNVLGVYGTGAYEGDKWGLKMGLRVENTDLDTYLVNTDKSNDQNFTNWFPSAHTSYKLTENFSLQAGYSRRIYRPRLWDLNPFFNIRNNFSIRVGNPDLLPEFTDSYELSSVFVLSKVSLNASIYYRYTEAVIERVSTFADNVTTFRPVNLGTNRATGFEFNTKYSPNKWFTLNGDFNYSYFNREGTFESTIFDFQADLWTTRWTSKFKLPKDLDFEITGRYESSFQTVQGRTADILFADLGLRKKILKGRGVLNFSVRDLFASRIRENETIQETFYAYSRRLRGRFITFGFSYGFGKGEAMEYSGRRR